MFDESQTNNKNTNKQETPASHSDDPFSDKLSAITNERGEPKYKDVDTALEALKESQQFIEQLKAEKQQVEQEKREREEQLAKMGSIEDFVNRVSPNAQPKKEDELTDEVPKGLSEEKVAELVQAKLQEQETQKTAKQNLETVMSKLSEVHGDQAAAHVKQVAEKLNTTPAALKEMAMSNPTLAITVLGGGSSNSTAPAASHSTRSSPYGQQDNNEKPTVERGKGAARGGLTEDEVRSLWKKSTEYTNKRLGVQS
jgi:hypothetical protein